MRPSDLKKRGMLRKIGEPVDFVITGTIEIKNVYKFKDFTDFWNLTPLDDFRELLNNWVIKDYNVDIEDRWYIYPDVTSVVFNKGILIGFQTLIRNKKLVIPITKSIINFCEKKGKLDYILSIGFSDVVPNWKPKSLRFYRGESAIFSGVYEQNAKKTGLLIHCPDTKVNDYINNDLDKFDKYLRKWT